MTMIKLNDSWKPFVEICFKNNDLAVIDALFESFWEHSVPFIPFNTTPIDVFARNFGRKNVIELYAIALTIARISTNDVGDRFANGSAYCRYLQYVCDESPCCACLSLFGKCPLPEYVTNQKKFKELIENYGLLYFQRIDPLINDVLVF